MCFLGGGCCVIWEGVNVQNDAIPHVYSSHSIRLTVCSEHTEEQLSQAAEVIRAAAAKHLTKTRLDFALTS